MSPKEQTLPDSVAEFVREFRAQHRITQPQFQQHARRHYGVNWSTGSVSGLEAGRMALSVPVLLVIAATLSDLSGSPVSLGDLIGNADRITLTKQLSISGEGLRQLVGTAPVLLDADHGVTELYSDQEISEMVERVMEDTRFDPPQLSAQDSVDANRQVRGWPVSLSVERAAKRMGISTRAMHLWSLRLWGHSLDDEVSERAGEVATAQKKGHVTRQLVKEIQSAIEASHG